MKHVIDTVANQSNALVAGAAVTVFISGTNTPAILYSDDGLTQKPNPVLTNSNGVFDFFVADGVYDLQVSGPNIATVTQIGLEIADITQAFGTDLNWQTENINFVNQTSVPGRPPTGSVELYSLASNRHIFLQDDTGTITDLTTGGGGGGGNLPGAPTNALQKNSGVNTFVASNVVDDGTNVSTNINARFKGPNPYTDVTAYGVRSLSPNVSPALPGITVTMNAGQTSATLSSPSTFQNGDGVTIYNAGAVTALTIPTGLTVTPMQAAAPTGALAAVSNTSTGATSYSYAIIGVDKQGGFTAASAVANTSTGSASLGSQNVTITGFTRSGNTVTATTSVAHGIVNGIVVVIQVPVQTDAGAFGGFFIVNGVPDSTHFTYLTGQDVADGAASVSTSGGTVTYFTGNRLTWTSVSNVDKYYVYGRTAGSLTLLGTSLPNNPAGGLVVNTWDDFGPTMMGNSIFPFYIPTTPPASAGAQNLTTTIVSGAGTTNLVLANAATTSVSNSTIVYDAAPGILAAKATIGGTGMLYFPAGQYTINSHLILGFVNMELAGAQLALNDTLEVNGPRIYGMIGPQAQSATAFGWPVGGSIFVGHTSVGVWDISGAQSFYEGIGLAGAANAQVLMLVDGGASNSQSHWKNINLVDGGGATDYMGISFYARGGFWYDFDHVQFGSGPGTTGGGFTGSTLTPGAVFRTGGLTFSQISVQDRGIFHVPEPAGIEVNITGQNRGQGLITPFFMTGNAHGIGGVVNISGVDIDTSQAAIFADLGSACCGAYVLVLQGTASSTCCGYQVITGQPLFFVEGTAANGQNNAAIGGYSFSNNPVNVTGIGAFMVPIINNTAPTLTVSAGGGEPVGTNCYAISMLDVNGNEGTLSPFSCVTLTTGNQTVTLTAPPAPAGAIGWLSYRGGAGGAGADRTAEDCFVSGVPYRAFQPLTTSFGCGKAPSSINRAGAQSISAAGVSGTTLNVVNNGFKTAISGAFTASHVLTLPDANSTVIQTGLTFATLGAQPNGSFAYCSDCTIANPCASGGTGALAKRLNGIWVCN